MSVTPNYGWPTPDDNDLVKDGAAAMRLLGDAIDATLPTVTIPVGGIILWSGLVNQLPDGWQLCDGSNGTPNLRDRFVVGAGGQYQVGSVGGQATVSLTVNQLPAHSHDLGSASGTQQDTGHTHAIRGQVGSSSMAHGDQTMLAGGAGGGGTFTIRSLGDEGQHTHALSGRTNTTGSGAAHDNMPPYYALAYIMRVS